MSLRDNLSRFSLRTVRCILDALKGIISAASIKLYAEELPSAPAMCGADSDPLLNQQKITPL
jgi:hypothetical protein